MKKIIIIFSSILVVAIIAFAVFKFISSEGQLKLIPKESIAVFTINFKSLSQKVDYDKIQKLSWYKEYQSQKAVRSTEQIFKDALKNPSISGINLLSNPYCAIILNKPEPMPAGLLVIKLSNSETFKSFIQKLSKDTKIKNQGAIQTMKISPKLFLAFNNDYALFVANAEKNAESIAEKAFNQEENITSVEGFSDFQSEKKDMGAFINYAYMGDLMKGINPQLAPQIANMYKNLNMTLTSTLNFEDSKIAINAHTLYHDEATKAKYKAIMKSGLSDEHLKCVSDKNILLFMGVAFNTDKLIALFKETEQIKKIIEEIKGEIGLSDTEINQMIGGEFSMAFIDFKPVKKIKQVFDYETFQVKTDTVTEPTPIFTVTLSTSNKTAVEKVIAKTQFPMLTQSLWQIPIPGMTMYLALTDKEVLLINDSLLATKFIKDKVLSTTVPEKLKSIASENSCSYYTNLNLKDYPESLTSLIKKATGVKYPKIEKGLSNFVDVVAKGSMDGCSVDINMTKSNQNSLMRILTIAE